MHDTTEDTRNTAENSKIIHIDEQEIRSHLDQIVRGTVEDTLNSLLDAETDAICQARRYERTPDSLDTRAGLSIYTQIPAVIFHPLSRRCTHSLMIVQV